MAAPDRQSIAVAADSEYGQLRPRQLYPGRNRQGPSMNGVETVSVCKKRGTTRAPDARYNDDLVKGNAKLPDAGAKTMMYTEVSAAGAPGGELSGSRLERSRLLDIL
jgi:hypothetical protein